MLYPATPDLPPAEAPVAAIVKVQRPWYAPRFVVEGKMRETMPQYARLPQLRFKAYSFAQADGAFGGVYLWDSAVGARTWFGPGWFERVRRERGVEPEVRLFEVMAVHDAVPGGTPADAHSPSVATLVLGTAPPDTAPGLLRRYTLRHEGLPGRIEIWRDAAAAAAAIAALPAGTPVERFDTPILLPTSVPGAAR